MGHRLSKIYTRTGDDGTTSLADGTRVRKSDARVEAYGSVDETNSAIGAILAEPIDDATIRESLVRIQHELFDLGADLSLPGYRGIRNAHVTHLEEDLDALNTELPPLKEFVLPAGDRATSACHLARSICRRAERDACRLAEQAEVSEAALRYLNRLSDYLFVAARRLARASGGQEVLWQKHEHED
jgi:cob(I)alamin adenosyltransferase